MKIRLPDTRLCWRKQLLKLATALVGLVSLFAPLAGCSNGQSASEQMSMMTPTSVMATQEATLTASASSWKLVWSDEFDGAKGTTPDPNKWTAQVGGNGWGNRQLEYDTNNQNAYEDGQGNLVLEARRNNPAAYSCWYGSCQYTSSRITTSGHFRFTYGYLEARIKIPNGQGIWSAFWLLGDNCAIVGWPACGEVDIMENISQQPATIHGTVHGPGYFTSSYSLQHGNFADAFHVFGLKWDVDHLYFFVDGNLYATLNRKTLTSPAYWVYDHPFTIVLMLPVGGNWPGSPDATTVFPQRMYISYVRLYQSSR